MKRMLFNECGIKYTGVQVEVVSNVKTLLHPITRREQTILVKQ